MSEFYTFDCGCRFPLIDNNKEAPKIDFSAKIEDINLSCNRTWELISKGNTKGCFQLESRLGQSMAKKLKPTNIEQLSALIAILRPGSLEAMRDGKSVSNHYIDKKNGLESVDYYHSSLRDILDKTYGEMIYQEQAMQIAQKIAGFDLQEADMLRKAIGKKKPEEMAKIKKKFLIGTKKQNIVNEEQATEIFGWIEKSQRYSFNKSHSVSYAVNAYLSAFAKAHFPKIFFASYLRFAKDKIDPQQEIKELVRNAIEMDIDISIPDFRNLNEFFILKNNRIFFGLTDIKGVGRSVFARIIEILQNKDVNSLSWLEMLSIILLNINSTASKALISTGAYDFYKKSRTEMLFEYEICLNLTKKELEYFIEICSSPDKPIKLSQALKTIIDTKKINKNRKTIFENLVRSIEKPPYSLIDKIEWISDAESSLLGVSVSCSKLDSYDISMTNTNCKEFKTSSIVQNIILAAEIAYINVTKTKTGKNPGLDMSFLSIEDQYGMLDSVILFPEQYTKYRDHLIPGNILVFAGSRSKSKDAFIVEKCFMPMT
jgi:DNA polymerase-3 subunit alpha